MPERETGAARLTDLLVVVLLADATQNAPADDDASILYGVLLVATILFWSRVLDWLTARFRSRERLFQPAPLALAHDGRLVRRNVAREMVTEPDLMSQLRLQRVDDLIEVKAVHLEGNGRVSVVLHGGAHRSARPAVAWCRRSRVAPPAHLCPIGAGGPGSAGY